VNWGKSVSRGNRFGQGIQFGMGFAGLRARVSPGAAPFPFDGAPLTTWYNGRAGIWHGLKCLGLGAGDRALVPAYACGSEIDPLIKAGMIVDSYRVLSDLSPDFEHLATLAETPAKALLVTHYFGFPQPIKRMEAFAEQNELVLIEDNSHGIYSADEDGRPLGSFGQLGIFSYPKSLPVSDGGCCVFNSPEEMKGTTPDPQTPSAAAVAGKVKAQLEAGFLRRFPSLGRAAKRYILDPPVEFLKSRLYSDYAPNSGGKAYSAFGGRTLVPEQANWGMSRFATFMLRRLDHVAIKAARRRNYSALDLHFRSGEQVRPLLGPMSENTCPWLYPVWAEDAAGLCRFMEQNDVECGLFWDEDHADVSLDDFPFERSLRRHVAILPIHQGLTVDGMIEVAELLNQWNGRPQVTIEKRD
jgi:perosamine synthetase